MSRLAKDYGIALTIDAEESERLDLSLDVIEKVFTDESLQGWNGFGLAVQSYQKRAFYVLDWVAALARSKQRRIMVRLIKGAYWDSEIKKRKCKAFLNTRFLPVKYLLTCHFRLAQKNPDYDRCHLSTICHT